VLCTAFVLVSELTHLD